jgi:hypothetical protein
VVGEFGVFRLDIADIDDDIRMQRHDGLIRGSIAVCGYPPDNR